MFGHALEGLFVWKHQARLSICSSQPLSHSLSSSKFVLGSGAFVKLLFP